MAEFVVAPAKLRNETCRVYYHVCLSLSFYPHGKRVWWEGRDIFGRVAK